MATVEDHRLVVLDGRSGKPLHDGPDDRLTLLSGGDSGVRWNNTLLFAGPEHFIVFTQGAPDEGKPSTVLYSATSGVVRELGAFELDGPWLPQAAVLSIDGASLLVGYEGVVTVLAVADLVPSERW